MKFNKISMIMASLLGIGTLATLGAVANSTPGKSQERVLAEGTEDYYAGIDPNASASSLLSSLKTLVNKNFHTLGYDGLLSAYHTTDKRADGYLNDYYSCTTNFVIGGPAENHNYSKEGDGYNREHCIPKSWWGGSKSNQGCDAFIVWPTDGYVNNRRSAYSLGEVGTVEYASNQNFSKLGSSKIPGGPGKVFEPNDKWKGDFARIHFYAIIKWGTTDWLSGEGSNNFLSNLNAPNYGLTDYALKLFTKWHAQDPVDDWEIARNDHVQALQNNRNPFIDHPEWVNKIWGGEYVTKEITKLEVTGTPTKTVYSEGQTFSPAGLTVTATFDDNSTEVVTNLVAWNPSILEAGNTSVVGSYKGKTITVSGLTVNPATVTGITVSEANTKLKLNGVFSFDGTVTASLNNGLTKDVTSQATFTGYDLTQLGKQTVTVTYKTFTTTYEIEVKETVAGKGYKVAFKNTSDDSTAMDAAGLLAYVSEGSNYISSFTGLSKIYKGGTGIKMASGSGAGSFTMNLSEEGKQNITGIKITTKKYSKDSTVLKITSNLNSTALEVTPETDLKEFEVELEGKIEYIKIDSTKRAYLSSIEMLSEGGSIDPVHVTGVSLNKTSTTLNVGDKETLIPTVAPENADNNLVSWSSSDDSVATINEGVVTAIGAGTATITVTTQDGNFKSTCTVTVSGTKVNVTGVSLNKTTFTGTPKTRFQLVANVAPANASNKAVTWSSSNSSIASVDSNGMISCKVVGTATITVTTVDGNYTATCAVTVIESAVSVTGVSLNKASIEGKIGETQQLVATVTPADATNKDVQWLSSDASIATVDETGKVTFVAEGNATITVKTIDGNYTATCNVKVTKAEQKQTDNGCQSSVITSSIIVCAISLMALGFLSIKKIKFNKQ